MRGGSTGLDVPTQTPQPAQQQSTAVRSGSSMSPAAAKREGTAGSSLHSLSDDDDDDDLDSDYRSGGHSAHGGDSKPTRKRKRKGLGNWTRTTLACVRCRKMKIRVSLPRSGDTVGLKAAV